MISFLPFLFLCFSFYTAPEPFADKLLPAPKNAGFRMENYWVWDGSTIRGEDGKYHLFASRWPKKYPFFRGYLIHSEVVRAVADRPEGPYTFAQVVLPPRGEQYWDGRMTHNPCILKYKDTYLLYYIGSTFPGRLPDAQRLKEDKVPQTGVSYGNIRIGLATATSIAGPWKRLHQPVLLPRSGKWDSTVVTNPAPCVREDGSIYLVYRSNTPEGLRFGVARAPRFDKPFVRLKDDPILQFGKDKDAEDPFIWWQQDHFEMVMEDHKGGFTGLKDNGVHATSVNGVDWKVSEPPLAYTRKIRWDDGTETLVGSLERPSVLLENGVPAFISLATADGPGGFGPAGFDKAQNTWITIIPMKRP
jgi:hypothetical protein